MLRRALGGKQLRLVYAAGGAHAEHAQRRRRRRADRERFCIGDGDVLELADYAIRIEDHYSQLAGHPMPMDIEWAKDGADGELYIVQARPETVASQRATGSFETYALKGSGPVLVTGRAVGEKIATGVGAGHRRHASDLAAFQPGEVLVAETTSPDWEPVMKTAGAIVTNRGGRTCHAAIVARELGIPAVVGAEGATETLATGTIGDGVAAPKARPARSTTASYRSRSTRDRPLSTLPRPAHARSWSISAIPNSPSRPAMLPNDGVGLARMEFIISRAYRHPSDGAGLPREGHLGAERERDRPARAQLSRSRPISSSSGCPRASARSPRRSIRKPVIVRLSDFKTNEYASLIGGAGFEPKEENPMLGFRGAARYAHPAYAAGFALECAALTPRARARWD